MTNHSLEQSATPAVRTDPHIDLSIVIQAINEANGLTVVLRQLRDVLADLGISHEVLITTTSDDHDQRAAAVSAGATLVHATQPGYGGALLAGFARSRGDYVMTMDADTAHSPGFIENMWKSRENAEVTIASRYVSGGLAHMPLGRRVMSRALNWLFSIGLNVPIQDLSSGFRLYKKTVLQQAYTARDFDILQEIVVRAYADGWQIQEVPFTYRPRQQASFNQRLRSVGMASLTTFGRLWKLRNSILAADYDDRAHDSRIPLQRYWQRARYRHITEMIAGQGPALDVGCGSSRIIGALPHGSVAVDILKRKLRYARKFKRPLVHASAFSLPFPDNSFPCVLCSQVIEHVPKESPILSELSRVLAPGGRLVLGTPDYAHWEWILMEKLYGMAAPGGYADEHIAHYTYHELKTLYNQRGYVLEDVRYILRGELIMAFRKPGSPLLASRT